MVFPLVDVFPWRFAALHHSEPQDSGTTVVGAVCAKTKDGSYKVGKTTG